MEILFHKTIEQCRQLGARGGRAHARNLRHRKFQPPVQPGAEIPGPPSETAHEASLRLDAQFPWLAAAFVRRPTLKARLKDLQGQPAGATLEPTRRSQSQLFAVAGGRRFVIARETPPLPVTSPVTSRAIALRERPHRD